MPTNNAWNSNIPVEISKGGTNATSMTNTDGVCYFDGTSILTTTVGTAGQVLTSNGPAVAPTFQASSPQIAKITLTSQQIKALNGTPITVVAAQGANTIILPVYVSSRFVYGGNSYFTAGAAQSICLFTNAINMTPLCTNTTLTGGDTKYFLVAGMDHVFTYGNFTAGTYDNKSLYLQNPIATEITGNVQNDDSLVVSVFYTVANLT